MISGEENISYSILNCLSECLLIVGNDGVILFYNESSLEYPQIDTELLRPGMRISDIFPADWATMIERVIQRVAVNGISQTSELEYRDTEDRSFFFEVVYNPVPEQSEQTTKVCIMIREITHLKTFEKRTIQLLRDYTNLIENANALIFGVDSREYVTEWNKECTRLTLFNKNDVLARKIVHIVDPSCHENLSLLLTKVLSGKAVSNQELLIKSKEAEPLTVLVNITPKMNDLGNPVGAMFVGQDITELSEYRKSLEQRVKDRTEKLKQALQKEKELVDVKNRFVSIASHEFKIPLTSIQRFVESIKKNPKLRKNDVKELNDIERQVAHMRELLEDILALEKGEVAKLKANYQAMELISFLRELVEEVERTTQYTHRIATEFSHPVIEMKSDDKLLRNIFINLLSNAIKFSSDNNKVELSVKATDTEVKITVTDYGIGIHEDDMNKIFEPFNRGSNVGNIKGTGLGLSIVKKAVETLGGQITIESVLNRGTTIEIKLMKNNHSAEV